MAGPGAVDDPGRTWWQRARATLNDPVTWTDTLQIVKTVLAAVVAWLVASEWFDLPQAFLAPWSALLVVHATVYRSFWTGARQITATVVGVLLAWLTGLSLGPTSTGLAVMLLVALAFGQVRWLRAESTTAAATALFVLTTGASDENQILLGRLLDAGIGVGVGVAVNALVWPPLRDLSAGRAIQDVRRHVGDLLIEMAQHVRGQQTERHIRDWAVRADELDDEVDHAWALVRQARESGRLNPRRYSTVVREPGSFGDILSRTEQCLAEIRSMARTVEHSIDQTNDWDDAFRVRWSDLLEEAGQAIRDPDGDRLGHVRAGLRDLATWMSDEDLPARHWPEYGGLILNLRNITSTMNRVATTNPIADTSRGPLRRSAL